MSEETYCVIRYDSETGVRRSVAEHLTIRDAEIYCDVADNLDGAGGSNAATYAPKLEVAQPE